MHRAVRALAAELHPQAIALGRELQGALCALTHLQQPLRAIGQDRTNRLAVVLQLKAAARGAVRLPTIAAAERVSALGCGFGLQGTGNHRRCSGLQTHRVLLEQHRAFALDECGIELRSGKRLTEHHMAQKLHIGVQADDVGLRQGRVQPCQGLLARVAMHDELGHHGVIKRADGVAFANAVVDADGAALKAAGLRLAVHLQRTGGGQKVVVGVFGADACFDGVTRHADLALLKRQRLTAGHAQLPLDQIEAGDGFGHRVLHLQPRVHFHEIELHRLGLVIGRLFHDEFHRARAHIIDRLGGGHSGRAHLRTQGLGHARGRGFFEHFLVAALHRAVALEQIHAVALRVAKYLDLDVAWALHVLFDQHRIAAKAVDGFTLATRERCGKVF